MIQTDRLILRALTLDDVPVLQRLISPWPVIRMLAQSPHPYTLADAEAFAAHDAPWRFAIDRDGLMGVVEISDHLGYWLGQPFWGRGYMTEAAAALIDSFFTSTATADIASGAFADNPGSYRVLEKLGFVATGTSQVHCVSRGEAVAHTDMTLTYAAWRART